MFIAGVHFRCALQRSAMWLSFELHSAPNGADQITRSRAINILLFLRNSLRYLCVLCGKNRARTFYNRRDAENAEVAHRIIAFH
jgi:hypothetical protein